MPTLYILSPYFINNETVITIKTIEIITSTTPIWPKTNNEGDNIADIKGIKDNIFINKEPLNTPAIIDK